jgi:hypothetical protein
MMFGMAVPLRRLPAKLMLFEGDCEKPTTHSHLKNPTPCGEFSDYLAVVSMSDRSHHALITRL